MWDISVFLSNMSERSACVYEKKAFLNMFTLLVNLKAVDSTLQFIWREETNKSFFFLPLAHWASDHIMLLIDTWLAVSQKILHFIWVISLLYTLHEAFK